MTGVMEVVGSPLWLFPVVFIFGALIGSFLNVCIVRIPKGESIVRPPSHCPSCKTPIPFYDNIPLVSFLLLRGRCRSCGERISPRYFFVELLTAVLAVAIFVRFGPGIAFAANFVFVAALIVISFIDLDVRIVPDAISLPGIALGLVSSVIQWPWPADYLTIPPSPLSSFIGILVGGGFLLSVAWAYQFFTGVEGMGGGDVKLLAMIRAFLGWPAVPLTLFFPSLTGSVIGLALMWKTGAGGKYALPFAPFLCVGAIGHLFFGSAVVQFYLPS